MLLCWLYFILIRFADMVIVDPQVLQGNIFLNTYRYRHLWLLQGLLDFTRLAWDWGKQHLRDISYLLFWMIILRIYIYIRIHNVWEKNLFHNSFVVAVFLWMTSQDASSLVPRAQAAKLHCWASSVWLSNLVPTELNSGYLQSGFWNSANTEEYGNPWKS